MQILDRKVYIVGECYKVHLIVTLPALLSHYWFFMHKIKLLYLSNIVGYTA